MRRRPRVTVQPAWTRDSTGAEYARGELRLRGMWLLDVFPLHTQVQITREERNGKIILVLEALEKINVGAPATA